MNKVGITKTLCLTIDIEPDFGGLLNKDFYEGLEHLHKLKKVVDKYDLKITAFVTGKTLEDNPNLTNILNSMKAEIGQHSYSHQVGHESKIEDIEQGIQVHRSILGSPPTGYRAPQGIITKNEAILLEKNGIRYDSSIFPAFFPGRFNRLHFPTYPFNIKDTTLMEIPFSVIPKIRIPIGLSYMQLLGLNYFKMLFKVFGIPPLLIFDFHTYELGKVNSFENLPFMYKLGYFRSQKLYHDPFIVFESFIEYIISKGYKSDYLYNIYLNFNNRIPVWDWK